MDKPLIVAASQMLQLPPIPAPVQSFNFIFVFFFSILEIGSWYEAIFALTHDPPISIFQVLEL